MPERTVGSVFRCRWGNDDEGRTCIFVHLLRGAHDQAGEFFNGVVIGDAGATVQSCDSKMVGMCVTETCFEPTEVELLLGRVSEIIGANRLARHADLQAFVIGLGHQAESTLREMAEQGLVEVLEVV